MIQRPTSDPARRRHDDATLGPRDDAAAPPGAEPERERPAGGRPSARGGFAASSAAAFTHERVAGVSLALRQTGPPNGAPTMLLHGFTGSADAVAPFADRLADSRGLRVASPDLIGHGRSECPEASAPYRVESMARQVLLLADRLEFVTFHLVGYSMGGRVALAAACAAPERLRSLTLIGATAGIVDDEARRRRARADEALAERITADFESFVDEWMSNPLFAGQAALGQGHLRGGRAQRLASDPLGLARSLRHGGTATMTPLDDRLGDCDVTTLLVTGARDPKFTAIAHTMASAMPRAETAVIADAGHAVHLEQPERTVAVVGDFIAAAEAARADRLSHDPDSPARGEPWRPQAGG